MAANKVYDYVTERIVKALEAGTVPWHKPWADLGASQNLISRKPYRGINVLLLALSKFKSPFWLTLNQAKKLKGVTLRKGEKSHMVVFYKTLNFKEEVKGKEREKHIPYLKYYLVFNVEQFDGIEQYLPVTEIKPFVAIEEAARIAREMPKRPNMVEGGRASYMPMFDRVTMPAKESFDSPEEYYSTLFHELAHSTGHSSRLKRFADDESISSFGSDSYSKEELLAEMAAAFLCATAGIENKTVDNSAAYINMWLKKLQNDTKLIVQAANGAQKAADNILNVKPYEPKSE
jgi:antirestriction protein ArdC